MPPYQAGSENCCALDSLFLLRLNDLLFIRGTSTIGTCCTLHQTELAHRVGMDVSRDSASSRSAPGERRDAWSF